jgi:hypothetical protein
MACYNFKLMLNEVENKLKSKYTGEELEQEIRTARESLKWGYAGYTLANGKVSIEKDNGQKFQQEILDIRIHKDFEKGVFKTSSGMYKADFKTGEYYYMNGEKVGKVKEFEGLVKNIEYAERDGNVQIESILSNAQRFLAEYGDDKEVNDTDHATVIGADMINNPDKILEMFDAIREQDGVKIDDEHADMLKSTLRAFVDPVKRLIPEMTQYVDMNAKENYGELIKDGMNSKIKVGVSKDRARYGNQMSAAEKYVHEIMHAALTFAEFDKKKETVFIMERIRQVHDQIVNSMTWEDFLPEVSIDRKMEEKKAQERYEYMLSGDAPLSEFMAMALTNKALANKLKSTKFYEKKKETRDSLWKKTIGYVTDLFDTMMRFARREDKGVDNFTVMSNLLKSLAEYNNKAVLDLKEESALGKAADIWEDMNDKTSDMLKKLGDKLGSRAAADRISKNRDEMSKTELAISFGQSMGTLLFDKRYRPAFRTMMHKLTSGVIAPEGTLQQVLDRMQDADTLQRKLEYVGLQNTQVDRVRKETINNVGGLVLKGFKEKPTKEEQITMTKGLIDIEAENLYEHYKEDMSRIPELYKDDVTLRDEISKVEEDLLKLVDEKTRNYYVNQARGLGMYMATGKPGKAQRMNADSIVMYGSVDGEVQFHKKYDEIVEMVDKLATLEGIRYTPQGIKDGVVEMYEKDSEGIENMLGYVYLARQETLENMAGREHTYVKGYMRESTSMHMHMEVAPIGSRKKMEEKGYMYIGDTEAEGFAYYVNDDNTKRSYTSRGMRLTSDRRATFKMSSSIGKSTGKDLDTTEKEFKRAKRKQDLETNRELAKQFDSIQEPEVSGYIPVLKKKYDKSGQTIEVSDYEIAIEKESREAAVESNRRAPMLIGHMMAHVEDVRQTKDINKRLLNEIYSEMAKNYVEGKDVGRDGNVYVTIGPNEDNKISNEVWNVLPPLVKKEIVENAEKAERPANIAVRRDLALQYFGNREPSILDLSVGGKTVEEWMPKIVSHAIAMGEMIWKEIVTMSKVSMVIRTPEVLLGNIISNYLFSIMAGRNPLSVFKGQMKGVKELNKYLKWEKEHNELKFKIKSGAGSAKDQTRIKQLDSYMKSSSAYPLIKAGLYQAIADDVEMEDMDTKTYLRGKLDKITDKVPGLGKTIDWLFITDRTELFKAGVMTIQASDFAARYDRYYAMKDKVGEEKAIGRVLDDFVNYNIVDPVMLQYVNKMGGAMFTKFLFGIQRALKKVTIEKPLNVAGMFMGNAGVYDADDVTDQYLFTKDYYGVFPGFGGIVEQAATPSAVEAASYLLNRGT